MIIWCAKTRHVMNDMKYAINKVKLGAIKIECNVITDKILKFNV